MPAINALAIRPALDALVIVKGDKIVLEHYADGGTPTSHPICMGATKSLVNPPAGRA